MIKNIKTKNPTLQKVAPLLLALIIVFTYSYLFVVPAFKSWRGLTPKVNKLREDIKLAQSNINNLESLKTKLSGLKERVGNYENRLPRQKEIPAILENLSMMALESGVKIIAIEPSKETLVSTSRDYVEIPVNLMAKCTYHQLGAFISKLENSSRFMKITNLKISRNHDDVYHHSVDLKISTFVLMEENS